MSICQCGRKMPEDKNLCGVCIPPDTQQPNHSKISGVLNKVKAFKKNNVEPKDLSNTPENPNDLKEKIQAQLAEKLEQAFEKVVRKKHDQYQKKPQTLPCKAEVKQLINECALTNAGVSGGASLVPGPAGMATVIPEIMMVTRNQIGLVYDIAAAHGKKDLMTKDLAAMVFASALGRGAGSLLIMKGGNVIVSQLSKGVLKTLFNKVLAGRIAHSVIKSSVSKWLPGVGAMAMAAWSNYTTRKIGERANTIFASELTFQKVEVKKLNHSNDV